MEFALSFPKGRLAAYVEVLTFSSGYAPKHHREKLIPEGATQIVVDLTDRPKRLYAGETTPVGVDFAKSWISGIQQRWIVIEAQQAASMLVMAAGVSDDALKSGNMPLIFGLAFVFSLLMAANLAFLVTANPPLPLGMIIGYSIAAGLGFASFGLAVVALFERRPLSYFLINGGYLTLAFAVMGLIIGVWR